MRVKPSIALQKHREAIRQIVARHRAANARVFGSVLEGTDDEGSIRLELRGLLGVEVDVLTPDAIPDSFRDRVITIARPV